MPTTVLVDFGASSSQAASSPRTWNNSHPGNVGASLALLDVGGASAGVVLSWLQGGVLASANANGTQQPLAGSPLAALGYPGDALRDSLYGHQGNPLGQFQLTGLDPAVVYDFTFAASRIGVSDVRTTTYQVQGMNYGAATLDVANNDSQMVAVLGIAPDPGGVITVSVSAAATNTNPSGFYYLGTMEILEGTGAPQMLGFAAPSLDFSMVEGAGTATGTIDLQTNNITSPTVALSAVEAGTSSPPAWLTLPGAGAVGTPVSITVDSSGLPVGAYAATITASAPGYVSAAVNVSLVIRASGALNLLFYGNSYTLGNGTIPVLVKRIAEEAGLPSPNVVPRLVGGQNLGLDPISSTPLLCGLSSSAASQFALDRAHVPDRRV